MAWSTLILVIGWLAVNWPGEAPDVAATKNRPDFQKGADVSTTENLASPSGNRAEIITELLNLRSEPNTNKKTIIGTLRKGLVIEVLDKKPGWLQVKLQDGRAGFVAYEAKYIRFLDQ